MTELASDDFTRADNVDLGAAWTPMTSAFKILGNVAVPHATGSDAAEFYNGVSFPDDQYSEAVLGGVEAGGVDEGCGVMCRCPTGGVMTGYRLVGNGSGFGVLRFNTGAATTLQTGSGTTFASGNTLRLEVRTNGANCDWSAHKNGVQFASGSDTSPIASGSAGIAYSSSDPTATLASWAGGDFEAPPPISDQPETLHVIRSGIRLR